MQQPNGSMITVIVQASTGNASRNHIRRRTAFRDDGNLRFVAGLHRQLPPFLKPACRLFEAALQPGHVVGNKCKNERLRPQTENRYNCPAKNQQDVRNKPEAET